MTVVREAPAITRRERRSNLLGTLATTCKYASLIIACIVMLLPLIVVFMTSLKTTSEMASGERCPCPATGSTSRTTRPRSPRARCSMAFGNTLFILVFSITGHGADRVDGRLRHRPVRLPAQAGWSSGCSWSRPWSRA